MSGFVLGRRGLLLVCGAIAMSAAFPHSVQADTKPKIGFIGAGHIGGTLAKLWTQAGYQVMLSARDLGPVKELAAQLGPNASVGTPAEAAHGVMSSWSPCPTAHCRRWVMTMRPSSR